MSVYSNYSPYQLVTELLSTDNPHELNAIQRALDNQRRGAYDRKDDFLNDWD